MKILIKIIILLIIIPSKSFSLIEVDITRGNLNPLPIAVSPLFQDDKTSKSFQNELNIKVLKKPTKFQIDNNKLFIGHGDGLGPGDYKYKFLKLILRNVITKKLFSFLHPDIAISLGNYLSRKNKIISGNDKKFSKKENELLYHFCKEKLNEEYFNYFIFGHRHCPLEIDLGNNSKYLNTGDWISFYSYIEYDGTSFSFKYFKD